MTRPEPLRLHASRRIDVDLPTAALLLAGPGALELWPAASVHAEPPRPTPLGYVTRFSWSGPELPVAAGVLRFTPAPGGTVADLSVVVAEPATATASLLPVLEGFLAGLARAAQDRRRAA